MRSLNFIIRITKMSIQSVKGAKTVILIYYQISLALVIKQLLGSKLVVENKLLYIVSLFILKIVRVNS